MLVFVGQTVGEQCYEFNINNKKSTLVMDFWKMNFVSSPLLIKQEFEILSPKLTNIFEKGEETLLFKKSRC